LLLFLAGCGGETAREAAPCPETLAAPEVLPRVRPEELRLEHWLALEPPARLDAELMTVDEIAAHERALAERGRGGRGGEALLDPVDPVRIAALVRDRLSAMEDDVRRGALHADGRRLSMIEQRLFGPPAELPPLEPEIRVALEHVAVRCSPFRGALRRDDGRFDRNLCSTLRPQEPVQLLLEWPNGSILARTPYVLGWIDDRRPLSPPLEEQDARPMLTAPQVVSAGTCPVPLDGESIVTATATGLERSPRADGAVEVRRPLTRRAYLTEAFARLGHPYGWAGEAGGCDCSSLAQEVFASFGIHLPRSSAEQQYTGTRSIALEPDEPASSREHRIDAAHERGIVLLTFPGHVMLYLGRSDDRPMALHALAEYVEPCESGGETLRLVDRVVVSDLSLGAGSSRRSLLERVTRIVIFGPP
jgi:hypothetical protein